MTEKQLFDQIIAERPPVSYISGQPLGSYLNSIFRYNCCAHVIPKKGCIELTFPNTATREKYLRLNPENIVLITPSEHVLVDQGTEDQRRKHELNLHCTFDDFYMKKDALIQKIKKQLEDERNTL